MHQGTHSRDNFAPESSHVIPALIRKCFKAKQNGETKIEAWGDGTPTREFLYAEDAAEGILLAAERYNRSDPVNLGSSYEMSIEDLVQMIAQATDFDGDIFWNDARPNGQPAQQRLTCEAFTLGHLPLAMADRQTLLQLSALAQHNTV